MIVRYKFFFKNKTPFSQWTKSPFKDQNGNWYSCMEQYMMAEKARMFGDEEIWREIMVAKHPSEHKALGRKVKGFQKGPWDYASKSIVWKGNLFKFTQNKIFQKDLMFTVGITLVEASPHDSIWGIGMAEDDPKIGQVELWGENRLGIILTEVREFIFNYCLD